ncbi:MAG: OmpA family protein [Proteobacteria bacterium]|nr:OmpA family protein [Pseudomonadota bacterium]
MRRHNCLIVISAVLISSLLGCTQRSPGPTLAAATVGGGVGAGFGAMAGSTAAGGIVGAVGGALLYQANQSQTMEAHRLRHYGATIFQIGDKVTIVIPSDRIFDTPQSAEFNTNSDAPLQALATLIKHTKNQVAINITGYTDNVGDRRKNKELSLRQAQAVAGYLWAQGIPSYRLHTAGLGEKKDIASNDRSDGSWANRRIEIKYRVS